MVGDKLCIKCYDDVSSIIKDCFSEDNSVDKQLHQSEDKGYSDTKTDEQKSSFLMSKEEIQKILPKPPSNLSKSTYEDLIELSKLTKDRTKDEEKFILSVDDKVENAFRPFLDKFNLEFPNLLGRNESFFQDFARDIEIVKYYYYNRPRPEQLADKYGLKINVIRTKSIETPSYPSGHSVYVDICWKKYFPICIRYTLKDQNSRICWYG